MVADTNGHGSKLVLALIAAKKKFKPLVKNKFNPHFKNRYADLSAVGEAVDDALASEGLTVIQTMAFDEKDHYGIVTKLEHVSGDQRQSFYPLPGGSKPQELASAITYGRRNSKCAILDLAAEDDDDAEAAEGRVNPPQDIKGAKKEEPKKEPSKADPKKDVTWRGTVSAVEQIKNGLWKVTGGDTSTFATSTPEHKDAAEKASKSLAMVEIGYRLNNVGSKVIDSLKEIKQ